MEVMDLCVPLQRAGQSDGVVVATLALGRLLEESVGADMSRGHEFSFIEGDGTRLARAGARRGAGVFVAERVIDLPGQALQLRVDSGAGSPSLIPNLAVALVLGLSLALARGGGAAGARRAPPRWRRGARWPRRWRSARRWKTRWSPGCVRAT